MSSNSYTFSAIRGIQAGREYYVIMAPLKLVPKIFEFDSDQLPADLRAQRVLSKARVPQIAHYLSDNFEAYTLSSLCASVDGEMEFIPASQTNDDLRNVGQLKMSMMTRILLNDGQHRRAAIQEALKTRPKLENESISIVLFVDEGLERSQQMFADLNKNAVRPSNSLNVLYDRRDPLARLSSRVVEEIEFYRDFVELEKTSISNRAKNFITLSSLNQANKSLAGQEANRFGDNTAETVISFWKRIIDVIPDWQKLQAGVITSGELRKEMVHAHGVLVQALGVMGARLIEARPSIWTKDLDRLSDMNWRKSNSALWRDRVMRGGRMDGSGRSIALAANVLINTVGLELDEKEQAMETSFELELNGRTKDRVLA